MDAKRSKKILMQLRRFYGDVRPDLSFQGIYQLAIAVVLSAQTTDRQVNEVTQPLFAQYPGFKELASAHQKDIEKIIRSTGFFRMKAKHIISLSREVMDVYGGKLPNSREELMKLPGIGRKSANVILSVGFGIPAFAVDTHISRIAQRLGYTNSNDPIEVEKILTSIIPENEWTSTHLLLIRHGRSLCLARNPQCDKCPVSALCDYFYNIRKK